MRAENAQNHQIFLIFRNNLSYSQFSKNGVSAPRALKEEKNVERSLHACIQCHQEVLGWCPRGGERRERKGQSQNPEGEGWAQPEGHPVPASQDQDGAHGHQGRLDEGVRGPPMGSRT